MPVGAHLPRWECLLPLMPHGPNAITHEVMLALEEHRAGSRHLHPPSASVLGAVIAGRGRCVRISHERHGDGATLPCLAPLRAYRPHLLPPHVAPFDCPGRRDRTRTRAASVTALAAYASHAAGGVSHAVHSGDLGSSPSPGPAHGAAHPPSTRPRVCSCNL